MILNPHEVYFRLLFTSGFIVFAAIISKTLARRRHAENALIESEEKYRSLVDSTDDSIYLVDRNYRYLFVNKRHLSRLGFPEAELLGHSYGEHHSPGETKEFVESVDTVFRTGESVQHEHKSERDNRYFLRTLSPVRAPGGEIVAVTVVSKQITERKRMEDELRTLSLTDELTGLYNRRGFFTLAEQQLKLANRLRKGISLLSADLDNLKVINDTLGHKEGDRALIDAADILRESFRDSDIIARIGGDEFIVLFTGNAIGDAEGLALRMQKNLAAHNSKDNAKAPGSYVLSISAGISYYNPEFPCSLDELLAQADKLMYEQKRSKHKALSDGSKRL